MYFLKKYSYFTLNNRSEIFCYYYKYIRKQQLDKKKSKTYTKHFLKRNCDKTFQIPNREKDGQGKLYNEFTHLTILDSFILKTIFIIVLINKPSVGIFCSVNQNNLICSQNVWVYRLIA